STPDRTRTRIAPGADPSWGPRTRGGAHEGLTWEQEVRSGGRSPGAGTAARACPAPRMAKRARAVHGCRSRYLTGSSFREETASFPRSLLREPLDPAAWPAV